MATNLNMIMTLKILSDVKPFYGNFGIYLRAYTYIRTMGATGLKEVSEAVVPNANYIKARLSEHFEIPYKQYCKHEFVLSGVRQKNLVYVL